MRLALISLLLLVGCGAPSASIVVLKNPATQQIVQRQRPGGADLPALMAVENCARAYEGQGFVRL